MMDGAGAAMPISRRERPAKAALTRDVIVETALRVIEAESVQAVTMRRIAQELDTGPASLYVYVQNRQHLLELAYDQVVAGVRPPTEGDWRVRLTALLEASVQAITRYPGLALSSLATVPTGPNAIRMSETVMGLLKEGGLSDSAIAWAVDLLGQLVTTRAIETNLLTQRAGSADVASLFEQVDSAFAAQPPSEFPLISQLRPLLLAGNAEERLHWFIQVVLNGLATTPPPSMATPKSWEHCAVIEGEPSEP
ncbi:MAG: TetR/AcrR family transcriptional regulator [Thermomicrobiales bacterium]